MADNVIGVLVIAWPDTGQRHVALDTAQVGTHNDDLRHRILGNHFLDDSAASLDIVVQRYLVGDGLFTWRTLLADGAGAIGQGVVINGLDRHGDDFFNCFCLGAGTQKGDLHTRRNRRAGRQAQVVVLG